MENIELTCICCPLGCSLSVEKENGEVVSVTGNTCPRGDAYARKEVINPTRIVTSSVAVANGCAKTVSCKTESDVPKGKIFEVIDALKDVTVTAPVRIGDIVLENVADTGVNVIATKEISC